MTHNSTAKIYVSLPAYYGRENEHLFSVLHLLQMSSDDIRFTLGFSYGDSLPSRMRDTEVEKFLHTDNDYILMIDADVAFNPLSMIRHIHTAREKSWLISAAALPKKGRQGVCIVHKQGVKRAPDTPFPCRWTSTACMLIHRDAFSVMKENFAPIRAHTGIDMRTRCDIQIEGLSRIGVYFLPFILHEDGKNIYMSEDYAFCEKANCAGIDIWINPFLYIYHIGKWAYEVNQPPSPTKLLPCEIGAKLLCGDFTQF
jgi:hypothetical protein